MVIWEWLPRHRETPPTTLDSGCVLKTKLTKMCYVRENATSLMTTSLKKQDGLTSTDKLNYCVSLELTVFIFTVFAFVYIYMCVVCMCIYVCSYVGGMYMQYVYMETRDWYWLSSSIALYLIYWGRGSWWTQRSLFWLTSLASHLALEIPSLPL